MSTRIVRECDQHAENGENVPAQEWVLTLVAPGAKPVTFNVDLCPDCSKPLVQLDELFSEIARKAKGGPSTAAPIVHPRDAGDWTCPECGHEAPNKSSLGSHSRSRHGLTMSQLLGEPIKFICKQCSDEPGFGSGTGFAAHRRSVHKMKPGEPFLPGENVADDRVSTAVGTPTKKKSGAKAKA